MSAKKKKFTLHILNCIIIFGNLRRHTIFSAIESAGNHHHWSNHLVKYLHPMSFEKKSSIMNIDQWQQDEQVFRSLPKNFFLSLSTSLSTSFFWPYWFFLRSQAPEVVKRDRERKSVSCHFLSTLCYIGQCTWMLLLVEPFNVVDHHLLGLVFFFILFFFSHLLTSFSAYVLH